MVERMLHVSADDIGLTRESTDAILDAADRGAVTSVSILANGFAFERAVDACRSRRALRVAVHVNLTEGAPVSSPEDVPHLVDATGSFKRSAAWLWAAYLFGGQKIRQALRRDVTTELSAQIEKVRCALDPDGGKVNIDGHQHAHMIPFVFGALCEIPGIREVRIPDEPLYFARRPYNLRKILAVLVLGYLARGARAKAMLAGIQSNDAFVGLLFSGAMTATAARAGLSAAARNDPRVSEIAFHPGYVRSDDLRLWTGDRAWHTRNARFTEHAFLLTEEADALFTAFRRGAAMEGETFSQGRRKQTQCDQGTLRSKRKLSE